MFRDGLYLCTHSSGDILDGNLGKEAVDTFELLVNQIGVNSTYARSGKSEPSIDQVNCSSDPSYIQGLVHKHNVFMCI